MDADPNAPTTYEVLIGKSTLQSAIVPTNINKLDIVPCDKRLADVALQLARKREPYMQLRNQLSTISGYGHIFFDSPPSVGVLTRNILAASSEVVIPVSLTYLSIDGCAEVTQTVQESRSTLDNPSLRVRNVVPTLFRNTRMANEILSVLQEQFGKKLIETIVGFAVQIDEAQSHGLTIWQYRPNSRASHLMLQLGARSDGCCQARWI